MKENVQKPTSTQVLRQLGLVVLIVALWGALFAGYLRLTGRTDAGSTPTPMPPEPTVVVDAPTHTPAPPRADTPIPTQAPADTPTPAGESATATSEGTSPPAVSFAADVLPLLESRCARCHGSGRADAGLNVTDYASLMAGSRDGAVVVPGDSAASLLVEVIVSGEMPRRGPPLLPAEIEIVKAWVDAGALDD
jgi:hypothetical protein